VLDRARRLGGVRAELAAVVVVASMASAAEDPPPTLAAVIATAPTCDAARATCLGIALHVPVTDQGPIATAEWVARQLAEANRHFAPLDVGFQIVAVTPLPESVARVEDREERDALGKQIGGTVVDVFLTGHLDDIDRAGEMAYGVTWRKGDKKFVIVSTQAWERTLAHELGHVFGLPHSKYAISIMNKTPRDAPAVEERTFHADELAKMKPRVRQLVRARVLANLAVKR